MDTDRFAAVVPSSVENDTRIARATPEEDRMSAAFAPSSRIVPCRLSRRAAARRLGGILAAGLLAAREPIGVFAQEATPPPLARFAGKTFVGATSEPDTFVAVVLGEAETARAYLCDILGLGTEVWLTGEASANRLDLRAEDGSVLTGIVTGAGVGGGATLADERNLVFTALPATGLAGLYSVALLPEGRLEGSSSAGATLVGARRDEGAAAGDRSRYDAVLTTPAGEEIALTITTATADEGDFRTIVLPDGRGRGQGKSKGGQVMDPNMDFSHAGGVNA